MKLDPIERIQCICASLALFALAAAPIACRADTVASLLGNFTINQYCGLRLSNDVIGVHYSVILGQLPALRELHAADTNSDGVTSQAERDAYVQRLAPSFANQLQLTVDDVAVPLKAVHWTTSLPTEQGGFSLRLDIDYSAALPNVASGDHTLAFANQNYAGKFGWQEIVVEPAPSMAVFATDAFSTSLTGGLTEALAEMPAAGPLSERAVHLEFTRGSAPAGAQLLQPRPGTAPAASQAAERTPGSADGTWLQRETRRLIALISTSEVAPHVALIALLAALVLGALHAFSPGHGKTVVGAYLIGSRATPRHALFLGLTVTITHTLGVFALGFATLFASRYVVPERLFPILSLVSGLLVLGMGIVLLPQRWRAAREVMKREPNRGNAQYTGQRGALVFRPVSESIEIGQAGRGFALAFAGGHHHHADHDHRHEHHHDHGTAGGPGAGVLHSHGGRMHSHLPPGAAGEAVTWRSLLALGISGGLVPCPSAMVLLLAAVALNKTGYGLLLVVAFSIGLAMTLIAVGFAFLYARNRLSQRVRHGRWSQVLPVVSAAAITIVGALLCYGALTGAQI